MAKDLSEMTESEIKEQVIAGNQDAINLRIEAGRQAAANNSNDGEIGIDEKPTGQTSEDVYPYTYWWVVGYNQYVNNEEI